MTALLLDAETVNWSGSKRQDADLRSMLVTTDRIIYSGLLGTPSCRIFGATVVYLAHSLPFAISINGGLSESAWMAIIPPNNPHTISSEDRLIKDILLEPESTPRCAIEEIGSRLETHPSQRYQEIRSAFGRWLSDGESVGTSIGEIDQFFFGHHFENRHVDSRIAHAVAQIRQNPCEQFFASECARLTGLSFSRFVHLFKEEIGMTFRSFCAWKRARSVLPSMTADCRILARVPGTRILSDRTSVRDSVSLIDF